MKKQIVHINQHNFSQTLVSASKPAHYSSSMRSTESMLESRLPLNPNYQHR